MPHDLLDDFGVRQVGLVEDVREQFQYGEVLVLERRAHAGDCAPKICGCRSMSSDVSDSAIPAKVRMISTLNSWISEEVLAMVDDSRARMSEIMRAEMRGVSMRRIWNDRHAMCRMGHDVAHCSASSPRSA